MVIFAEISYIYIDLPNDDKRYLSDPNECSL